uniref:Uncharacterized protein n=1 Tax=Siphoviridae sp. ctn8e14 TaxID=2827936 RepID=A0A8S5T5Z0_9CAUD|nr:MAG TPA: hypothetical protein [Siphoviridae sp. ctn8e14]
MRRNDAWLWYLLSNSGDGAPSPKRRHDGRNPGRIFGRIIIYAVLIACAIELIDS